MPASLKAATCVSWTQPTGRRTCARTRVRTRMPATMRAVARVSRKRATSSRTSARTRVRDRMAATTRTATSASQRRATSRCTNARTRARAHAPKRKYGMKHRMPVAPRAVDRAAQRTAAWASRPCWRHLPTSMASKTSASARGHGGRGDRSTWPQSRRIKPLESSKNGAGCAMR